MRHPVAGDPGHRSGSRRWLRRYRAVVTMAGQLERILLSIVAANRLIPASASDRWLLGLEISFRYAVAGQWLVPGDGSEMRLTGGTDLQAQHTRLRQRLSDAESPQASRKGARCEPRPAARSSPSWRSER